LTMLRFRSILRLTLESWLIAAVALAQHSDGPAFRLVLTEVRPGNMATQLRCTLVLRDHHFHHETASITPNRDSERKVYEGELSDGEWSALNAILDGKSLRDLNVPRAFAPPVMQDVHILNISVGRESKFQNLEFLNDKSRKPYDSELKPLLQWWKSFNHRHMTESHAAPNSQCAPNQNNTLFAQ